MQIIEKRILVIRATRVMIDADLAEVYGVSTKRLNQQVARNVERFPSDFMFRLTAEEKRKVVANCDHLKRLKFSSSLPLVFTEHGAMMLAGVLNSPAAVHASVEVVRAFVRLREILSGHKDFGRHLDHLERKYDAQFKAVFDAIRHLMDPPRHIGKKIGFQADRGREAR